MTWVLTPRRSALLLLLAIVAVYASGLDGPFVLDDISHIRDNPGIRRLWPVTQALNPPYRVEGLFFSRPFINLTMSVDYQVWGTNPRGYHITNLLLHLAAAWVLFEWLRRLYRSLDFSGAHHLALATSLLWALHPLNTAAVNYPAQRGEIAVGLFLFLSLYGLHQGATSRKNPPYGQSTAWLLASALACLAGMGSKESMAAAPLLAMTYDRFFLSTSWKEVLRLRGWFYFLLGATLLWPLYRHVQYSSQIATIPLPIRWQCLWTQIWGIARMIRLAFWPHPLIFDYGTALVDGPADVWLPCLFLLLLLGLTAWSLANRPRLGFAGLWFFGLLAPFLLAPVTGQPVAEHRMYAPLAALVALAVMGLRAGIGRISGIPADAGRRYLLVVAGFLAISLGWASHHRNAVYQDRLRLLSDTLEKRPANVRAWHDLGVARCERGEYEEALAAFAKAAQIDQKEIRWKIASQSARALALINLGRMPEAFAYLHRISEQNPNEPEVLFALGLAHLHNGAPAEARSVLATALELHPNADSRYRFELARACFEDGDPVAANEQLRHALGTDSSRTFTYGDLMPYYVRTWDSGERPRALSYFRNLVARETNDPAVLNNVAWLLATSSPSPAPPEEALQLARRALDAAPAPHPGILDTLAAALAANAQFEEAAETARRAVDMARQAGDVRLAQTIGTRLQHYIVHRPWRKPTVMPDAVPRECRWTSERLSGFLPWGSFFSMENRVLTLFAGFALGAGFLTVMFFRFEKRRVHSALTPWRWLLGNALICLFLIGLVLAGGESYFRFIFDGTDAYMLSKTSVRWQDRHYRLNASGIRDSLPAYLDRIAPGKRRITFVGDSFTAGHGIQDVERRFANQIRRRHPDWEVHVIAANGWETGYHQTLLESGLSADYEFDIVVLVYVLNDISDLVPDYWENASRRIQEWQPGPFVSESYFLDTLYNRFRMSRDPDLGDYYGFVAQWYRGPVWSLQESRLRAIQSTVARRGGRLLVATFPFLQVPLSDYPFQVVHAQLDAFWTSNGVPHLDLANAFRGYSPRQLVVNRFDAHPNETAHELAAHKLETFIQTHLDGP